MGKGVRGRDSRERRRDGYVFTCSTEAPQSGPAASRRALGSPDGPG
jgi:hypothetical protein